MLLGVGAEEAAHDRDVANDRRAILGFLHVLAHQAAEHHGLTVPHAHTRGHFAGTKDGLVDDVGSELDTGINSRDRRGHTKNAQQRGVDRPDWTPVIDEPLELDHLRHEVQVDCHPVGTDHWFHLERHTSVARLES